MARHSRSLIHAFGSHSRKFLEEHGIQVNKLPQVSKHRYIYFLDASYRVRLKVPVMPTRKEGWQGVGYRVGSIITIRGLPPLTPLLLNKESAMKTIEISLTDLWPAPWNPNRMDEKTMARLKQSVTSC